MVAFAAIVNPSKQGGREMARVMFISGSGVGEVKDMEFIPSVGDIIPIFYQPYPRVTQVAWFPEKILPDLDGKCIDVLITVA